MKHKFLLSVLFIVVSSAGLFAADFSLTTDLAYYTTSDYVSGGTHFAPVTGAFNGIEVRTTGNVKYKISTPFGQHPLVKDANLVINGSVELTPITVLPAISVDFTPVPFLVFSAGASFGLGWNFMGFTGLAKLEDETRMINGKAYLTGDYSNLRTLEHAYYDFWGRAIFQFDTGAIWEGDWNHVLLVAGYQVIYKGLSDIADGTLWTWRTTPNYANGLQYMVNGILAYQMPLRLRRVGVMGDISGHFKDSDYGDYSENGYDGTFKYVNISPFVQIDFNEANTLYILAGFATRQSFDQDHDKMEEEPYLTSSGYEWFFKRVAFSWAHYFN